MLGFVAWFSERTPLYDAGAARRRFDDYVRNHLSSQWPHESLHGDGWGIAVAAVGPGGWRWPLVARDGERLVLSIGVPVGVRNPTDPGALADRLSDDPSAIDGAVPPFAMGVVDGARGRALFQQDWVGMGQIYEHHALGVVVLTNRPTLAPYFLGEWITPDLTGWSHYLAGGFFARDTSPVERTRLLAAGERLELTQRDDGGWDIARSRATTFDDVVSAAAASGLDREQRLELAASGLRRAGTGLAELWPGAVRFGLSGGRDSRLVAAVMLSSGVRPDFFTTADDPTEADTAEELLRLAAEARGDTYNHERTYAGQPGEVLDVGVATRAERLLRRYDFLFQATYLARPAGPPGLTVEDLPQPTVGGAHGELAGDRWIPKPWLTGEVEPTRDDLVAQLKRWMGSDVMPAWQSETSRRNVDLYVAQIADHALALGLDPVAAVSYCWLAERMRRLSSQVHLLNQITPLLTPEFVTAAFAMSYDERLELALHTGLTARLMPEWEGVPYVKNTSGLAPSQIVRTWLGDGAEVIGRLIDSADGPLSHLVHRPGIRTALARAKNGDGTNREDVALRTFVLLATADTVFASLNAERTASDVAGRRAADRGISRWPRRIARRLPRPMRTALLRGRRLVHSFRQR